VVYPVGMTTYSCYSSWIIANNFVSIYHILTKLGNNMCPYTTFRVCNKFQGNQITRTFTKRRKQETKPIFGRLYLGNARHNLVEILNMGYWWWKESPQQKSSGFVQAAWSYIYMKIVLLVFLSIYSWCGALAFWAAWHSTVCFDPSKRWNNYSCKD